VGRRLTRRQIKKDEFISLFDEVFHWFGENWKQAAMGLGGALAVALIWWLVIVLLGSRSTGASQALVAALETFNAPVGAAAPADAKVKFSTDTERLAAAEKALNQIKSKYWLTAQARFAALYLARIAAERGDQAGALRDLTELASKKVDDPVVRLAMLDLVRLRVAKGEGALLAKDLEAMASGQDPRLPRDVATYQLAKLWESEGKTEEAARYYRKLIENFPESAYRTEAQQKLSTAS
jgi:tetratricopeptide (TPR) repeat protein